MRQGLQRGTGLVLSRLKGKAHMHRSALMYTFFLFGSGVALGEGTPLEDGALALKRGDYAVAHAAFAKGKTGLAPPQQSIAVQLEGIAADCIRLEKDPHSVAWGLAQARVEAFDATAVPQTVDY